MKKKKNILIVIMIILLIILMIVIVTLNKLKTKNDRTSEENLEYINSDELEEGTISPDMIHVVIALYEGELNPKAISKATYYFINDLVPEYLKKCKNEEVTRKYFEKNKDNIYLDIGINKEDEFVNLINEIKKLSGKLEFESSRFDKDSINVKSNHLETVLYIKYKDNEEIAIRMKLLNRVYENKTSIKFYAD